MSTATAYAHLCTVDPVLERLVAQVGRPDPAAWDGSAEAGEDLFTGLVLHIVGQQISIPAALAIFSRMTTAAGGAPLDPGALAELSHDRLREVGLSGAKALAIAELASGVAAGTVDLEVIAGYDDAGATAALVRLRGIGPWSAQMFLLHQLRRPDVLPAADVGLQRAVQRAWDLPGRPTPEELTERAAGWAPYRSYAAALLWASLRV